MEQLGVFFVHHWHLWLALIVVLTLIFVNELYAQKKKAQSLSASEAIALINRENALIFDLRSKEDYKKGHIANATLINDGDLIQEKFIKYKHKVLLFVCNQGLKSQAAASKLKSQGFDKAYVLSGGMQEWNGQSLPTVKK